ncbi:MAG: hypothetical protein EZS28_025237, partial [Streblomastix strix]
GEQDSRFSFQTCDIGRLFSQRRDPTRSTVNVEDKTIDRHVFQSPQQKVQEIREPIARQMGGSPRLSLNIMATGGTIPAPAYSSDTTDTKQISEREGISSDDHTILAISTVVACTNEDDIKTDYPMKKRRRLSPWREDEEVKEAPTTRKNDSCLVKGNRGEELFRQVLNQRGLTDTAIQNVINGWHEAWRRHRQRLGQFDEYWISLGRRREELLKVEDRELVIANFISQLEAEDATNANQANCRSALSTLFQLQGFKKEKINGVA